jgi:hypothetical protein
MTSILRELDLRDRIADAKSVESFINRVAEARYDDCINDIAESDVDSAKQKMSRDGDAQ